MLVRTRHKPVTQINDWWDALNVLGPNLGYFPESEKCWIIVKPEKEESEREAFYGTAMRVTVHAQKHFVAALGSREQNWRSSSVDGPAQRFSPAMQIFSCLLTVKIKIIEIKVKIKETNNF